jgi:hypothetical protein
MLSIPKFILYLAKDSKIRKTRYFFFGNQVLLSSLFYFIFSLNDTKKKLYVNIPEMFNFNPKTSIQKYPIFCSWYNVLTANVSDFFRCFALKK